MLKWIIFQHWHVMTDSEGRRRSSACIFEDLEGNINGEIKEKKDDSSAVSTVSIGSEMCKICHCNGSGADLIAPCYCSGSLKYVHQECLQRWIKSSDIKRCELCKYPFAMQAKVRKIWTKSIVVQVKKLSKLCRKFIEKQRKIILYKNRFQTQSKNSLRNIGKICRKSANCRAKIKQEYSQNSISILYKIVMTNWVKKCRKFGLIVA